MSANKYYTINETAELLSSYLTKSINKRDVLDLGARGKIGLCIWFNGKIELSEYCTDSYPEFIPIIRNKWFKGYLKIPKTWIPLKEKEFCIPFAEFVEALDSSSDEDKWLQLGEKRKAVRIIENPSKTNNYEIVVDYEDESKVEYVMFSINTDEILIPEGDLINLMAGMADKPITNQNNNNSNSLLALADQVAGKIREKDIPVTLNKISKELTKQYIRNKHQDLLYGQKGWHEQSWIKTHLKGWKDPILRK